MNVHLDLTRRENVIDFYHWWNAGGAGVIPDDSGMTVLRDESGEHLNVIGRVWVSMELGAQPFRALMYVVRNYCVPVALGNTFMEAHRAHVNMAHMTVQFMNKQPIPMFRSGDPGSRA